MVCAHWSASQPHWWWARLLAVAIAVFLADSGCRATRPADPPAPAHLAIALAMPASLRDPNATEYGLNSILSVLLNERLVNLSPEGRAEPALAARWERSPDGLTWRFFLRPNLRFHDGTPLDAPHVAQSLSSQRANPLTRPSGAGLSEISSITAEDETTLVFHLSRPSSLLIDALNVLWIRADQSGSSAGPFQLVSREKGRVHLRAFEQYFRGKPTIDALDVMVYPNARNAWSAMMRGEVDFLYDVTPEAIDFIEQSSRTQVKTFLRPYVYAMGFNTRHPVLSRREVRVALNEAVNRTQIIDVVFRGHAYPASNHVWPRHWAYDHKLPRFRFVPEDASRRLDEAGLPQKRTRDGRLRPRFSFVCLLADADIRYEPLGLMLQQQLNDVGVDMKLEVVPTIEAGQRIAKGDYDAVLIDLVSMQGLNYVYNAWHSPERPGEVYVFDSGYQAEDAALDRLQLARTDEETRAAVREVQEIMQADPPAIFICWSERARAVSSRFRLPAVPDRDIFSTLPQWQLITTPSAAP